MVTFIWTSFLLIALTTSDAKPVENVQHEVCNTEECKDAAKILISSMNSSVDPCENFYDFACGNWIKNHPLPSNSSKWGQLNVVKEKVVSAVNDILSSAEENDDHESLIKSKIFYRSCIDSDTMNSRGLKPLVKLLRKYGGWPMIESKNWQSSDFNLQHVLSDIKQDLAMGVLLEIAIEPDFKNAEKRIISIDQPSFFVSSTILLNPKKYQKQMNAYRALLWDIATAAHKVVHPGHKLTPSFLDQKISQIIAFETKLANISAKEEDRSNVELIYNLFTVEKLQSLNDQVQVTSEHAKINFLQYLQRFTKPMGGIDSSETIIVKQPQYLQRLRAILDETPVETVANYVQWIVASALIPETTDKMREAQFRFDRINEGVKKRKTLVKKCSDLGLLSSYYPLGYAVGTKYIKTKFTPQSKHDVTEMVRHLKIAFAEMLETADWLDKHTKNKALEKINAMREFIGYPDWLTNDTAVTEYFDGLSFQPGKHFENQIAILSWWTEKTIKQFRMPVDKNEVKLHPVLLNAMYSAETNAITFPAGILEPVFYRHKGHRAVNFGGIGVVIGHEITHGFDLRGSQYDQDGNAVNWWTPKIKTQFKQKAKRMMDQYSSFETPVGHVDGHLTVKENIADNGGLRQAFLSYRNWVKENNNNQEEARLPGLEHLSPDQLFFLGYANLWCQTERPEALQMQLLSDEHSPPRFRTLGPSMNFDAFAQTWNCPKGSPMNPEEKCVLW